MEEDLQGYIDWITQAEELAELEDQQNAIKVDLSSAKQNNIVAGLLKSAMLPLQQVVDGRTLFFVLHQAFSLSFFNIITFLGAGKLSESNSNFPCYQSNIYDNKIGILNRNL